MKEKIQADYNKITDFSVDWIGKLAAKYGISRDEVLDYINL